MTNPINCLVVDDEPVALEILENHISKIDRLNLIKTCANATEAFNYLSNHRIDLIFLDINMSGITGIAFAKAINSQTRIIFTTAYREYALEGFELQAVDYLLKPIALPRLIKAVENYLNLYQKRPKNDQNQEQATNFIFVKIDRKMIKLAFENILYIESISDYLKIHCLGTNLIVREKISAMEEKLPSAKFIRVHRSFIIALDKIKSYTHEQLIIEAHSVPISRSYKDSVLERLQTF